jgi:hypothetical protein
VVRRFPQEASSFTLELILLLHFERHYLTYNVRNSGFVGPWKCLQYKISLCDFALWCLFICSSDPNAILLVVYIHLRYTVQIELTILKILVLAGRYSGQYGWVSQRDFTCSLVSEWSFTYHNISMTHLLLQTETARTTVSQRRASLKPGTHYPHVTWR